MVNTSLRNFESLSCETKTSKCFKCEVQEVKNLRCSDVTDNLQQTSKSVLQDILAMQNIETLRQLLQDTHKNTF